MLPRARDRSDRCPGVLRPHLAADGAVVRLRVPGGQVTSASVLGLASVAERHGDGAVYLTSRGNVQLRGVELRDGGCTWDLVDDVRAAGLLPSNSHELVRNIVASPLTGLAGGLMDVRPVVVSLDAALTATPALSGLPGRFLFVVDDGRGDVAGMKADVRLRADSATSFGEVSADEAVTRVVGVAQRFVEARTTEWHIDELPVEARDWVRGPLTEVVTRDAAVSSRAPVTARPAAGASGAPYGLVPQDDERVAVSVLAPLGRLTAEQLRLLADQADRLVLTPWRGVVVPDLDPGAAPGVLVQVTDAGLVGVPDSPWARITACVGAPFCASAAADTMAAARRLADEGSAPAGRVHLVACERACGRPSGPHELVLVKGEE